MKYSIIVPVYNVEDYLKECVDSLLHQTYRDFEVLLIDDGSTDKSGAICDAYAKEYPQVKVIHQENCGANRSRIHGLENMTGDVCIFVDSDDLLRVDALEKIDGIFTETGCDLVLYSLSRDADFSTDAFVLGLTNGQCFEDESKKALYSLVIESGKLNSMCMKAAKKSVYDRFLPTYVTHTDMAYGEDLYMSLPLLTYAQRIVYLDEKLYYYRPREGSMVNSFCPTLHKSMKIVRMEMEKYIDLWGIEEEYPVFYTRVVYNWIYALKCLLKNKKTLSKEEYRRILREMSEDAFFRKAYDHMLPERLIRRDRFLADQLYQGNLWQLCFTGTVFNILHKQKR